jgi:hypothetical protein
VIGAPQPEKSAFNLAAPRAGGLRHDQQACIRVGGQLTPAPESAGRQFGPGVGGGVEVDVRGWVAESRFPRCAPGVEDAALHWEDAVKSGQKQWRALRRIGVQQRNQFERQAAGAEQAARAAGFVKSAQPTAEGLWVLLPTAPRRALKKARSMGAEQFVRLHGQRGQPMARPLEQCGQRTVFRRDIDPQSGFLGGIEQQPGVG